MILFFSKKVSNFLCEIHVNVDASRQRWQMVDPGTPGITDTVTGYIATYTGGSIGSAALFCNTFDDLVANTNAINYGPIPAHSRQVWYDSAQDKYFSTHKPTGSIFEYDSYADLLVNDLANSYTSPLTSRDMWYDANRGTYMATFQGNGSVFEYATFADLVSNTLLTNHGNTPAVSRQLWYDTDRMTYMATYQAVGGNTIEVCYFC